MTAVLTVSEKQAVSKFIEQVSSESLHCPTSKASSQSENAVSESWPTAIRFLMARKFNVQRALELYRTHKEIREKEGLNITNPFDESVRYELLTEKFTVLSNRDPSGAAIALFTARHHHPELTTQQAVLKALVLQLDTALDKVETQRHGIVFIYDMSSSKYTNFDYELSIKILTLLKGGYPARLKKVLVVTAPLWFRAPFKILHLFVRQKLRDRVYTVSRSQLVTHIAHDSLPVRLGGSATHDHRAWLRICLRHYLTSVSMATDGSPLNGAVDMDQYFSHAPLVSSMSSSVCSAACSATCSDAESPTLRVNGSMATAADDTDQSDVSKETVSEKHLHEEREKEVEVRKEAEEPRQQRLRRQHAVSPTSTGTAPPTPGDQLATPTVLLPATNDQSEQQQQAAKRRGSDTSQSYSDNTSSVTYDQADGEAPCKKRPTGADRSAIDESDQERRDKRKSLHEPESGGYTPAELLSYVKRLSKAGLCAEYARIRAEPPSGSFNYAKSPQNLHKNRYSDVLCYDHSRVVLKRTDDDPFSDYINANFVDGYKHKNAYISTQGCLENTFGHFWQMVWEQMVLVIVMTTRTVERNRNKCGVYWPVKKNQKFILEDYIITNEEVQRQDTYTKSILTLHNRTLDESRQVTHFQFTKWPDYGVPDSAAAFLDFRSAVNEEQRRRLEAVRSLCDDPNPNSGSDPWPVDGPPILVHCSAGIGRTGTFITMDISCKRLADLGTVNVQRTVRRIRAQRAFSIQMPDQYVFCYLALLEHAQQAGLLSDDSLPVRGVSNAADSDS